MAEESNKVDPTLEELTQRLKSLQKRSERMLVDILELEKMVRERVAGERKPFKLPRDPEKPPNTTSRGS